MFTVVDEPRRVWAARICQAVLRGRYARRRVAKMLDELDREAREQAICRECHGSLGPRPKTKSTLTWRRTFLTQIGAKYV